MNAADELPRVLGAALQERGWMLTIAESCTGGGVAQAVTRIAGSSEWFDRGFVTYSDDAKREMLGVSAKTLQICGAVSEDTVREMAAGALRNSSAHAAIAVSGIAGPGGGSRDKPVGTVCFAWATKEGALASETRHLSGDREAVRSQATEVALQGLLELLA
jgi:nicotinamide-nucleotide amidase